jgi:hypothetical protein
MSKDEPVLKPDTQGGLDPSSELYILQEELEALYDVEACEIFCYQLSQDIVDHSLAVVQDRYYDEKCIPFTVNCVAEQMFTILDVRLKQLYSYAKSVCIYAERLW